VAVHHKTCFYLQAEAACCRLGEHSLPMQHCVMIDKFPRLGSDPAVGWALPQGGAYHAAALCIQCQAVFEGGGGGIWEICIHHGSTLIPPPLCVNDSNQRAKIGVVARHPCIDALESLPVGFPVKEVVTLQGDPPPPPSHPPCTPPMEPCPRALAEMS
jgi:hypothetical protein